MTPTQSEVNETLDRIATESDDQTFYHELGEHNHNRRVARERIAEYRKLATPSETQMRSVVRGDDRYQPQKSLFKPMCLIVAMMLLGYALFRILFG